MSKTDKEAHIQEIMEGSRVTRAEAEFIYAQESGEIDSDVFVLVDPPVGPYHPAGDIEAWLVELRGSPQSTEVVRAIKQAEAWLRNAK